MCTLYTHTNKSLENPPFSSSFYPGTADSDIFFFTTRPNAKLGGRCSTFRVHCRIPFADLPSHFAGIYFGQTVSFYAALKCCTRWDRRYDKGAVYWSTWRVDAAAAWRRPCSFINVIFPDITKTPISVGFYGERTADFCKLLHGSCNLQTHSFSLTSKCSVLKKPFKYTKLFQTHLIHSQETSTTLSFSHHRTSHQTRNIQIVYLIFCENLSHMKIIVIFHKSPKISFENLNILVLEMCYSLLLSTYVAMYLVKQVLKRKAIFA